MGFICFYFAGETIPNYLMIPQMTNFIGSGIGGYVNLRHAHYLNAKIEKMYRVDGLTGLYNRRGFALEYQKILARTRRTDKITVVLADIDDLKKQVQTLYKDSALCEKFGKTGRSTALELYSRESIYTQLTDIYQRASARKE